MIRSLDGNMPNLLKRFSSHKQALYANLSCGIARGHRGNVAASLKIEKLYALPVLFSELASLVLTGHEVNCLDQHYLNTLRNLLKLLPGTPRSVVYFLAGSLPARAILHLRQLGLFHMISHLPEDPLFLQAKAVLTASSASCKSWFRQVRDICLMYRLPHPLTLLDSPVPKSGVKKLVRSLVVDHWEQVLRKEASTLPSLKYFIPEYHSLSSPHPILWTAGANPYEVTKAVIQCKMLSGRYRIAMLTRHFGPDKSGSCPAPSCPPCESETLEHLLVLCPHYKETRNKLTKLWISSTPDHILVMFLLSVLTGPSEALVQFLLDPSVHPSVIAMPNKHGQGPLLKIYHLTRSWCYSIHTQRLKLLRQLNRA